MLCGVLYCQWSYQPWVPTLQRNWDMLSKVQRQRKYEQTEKGRTTRHRYDTKEVRKRIRAKTRLAHRVRLNQRSQGRRRHRTPWEDWEIALLWDTSLTNWQLSKLLNRTLVSIGSARNGTYRHLRPEGYVANSCRPNCKSPLSANRCA
jgi:hypothetical protein